MHDTQADAHEESLRERKKWETRRSLRRAAVRLIARRGLDAVTVDDIASAAKVSTRTFFNYFPSKEDAVSGWDPVLVAELVERLRERPPSEDAPEALRAALLVVLPTLDADHRDLLDRLRLAKSDPRLLSHLSARWTETERQLVAALAERLGTDSAEDRYAALVVATTMAAARVAIMSWCDKEGEVSVESELALCFDALATGLVASKRTKWAVPERPDKAEKVRGSGRRLK